MNWILREYRTKESTINDSKILFNNYKKYLEVEYQESILDIIGGELSIFIECYNYVDYRRPMISSPILPAAKAEPDGWIPIVEALKMIKNNIDKFVHGFDVNLEIEKELYNVLTGEKSYLLRKGNISISSTELQKQMGHKLIYLLRKDILYILSPDERKRLRRKSKFKKILDLQ